MVTPACHPRTPEVEVEGLQGQGHPPLHSQSETILRYVKPNLKLEEKKKGNTVQWLHPGGRAQRSTLDTEEWKEESQMGQP